MEEFRVHLRDDRLARSPGQLAASGSYSLIAPSNESYKYDKSDFPDLFRKLFQPPLALTSHENGRR
jgi:hypothetical protein